MERVGRAELGWTSWDCGAYALSMGRATSGERCVTEKE